jgi:MerR HTH family regulatory protein
MADTPKTPDYFQGWYDEHRDDLNKRRRERYANDPAYRKRVQGWNDAARERRRKTAEAEGRQVKQAVKLRSLATWKTVEVEVDGVAVHMFTIGALAKALGKGISTIRVWERNGTLPETPHRSKRGDRLYTLEMVEAARKALYKAGKLDSAVLQEKKRPPYVDRVVVFRSGAETMLRLYKVGTLAGAVNRTVVALAQMEKRGVLPRTPLLASSLEYRLYTLDMIEVVQEAFNKRGGVVRGQSEWEDFHDEIVDGWTRLGIMDARLKE